jgi:2-polyprenyl-6-methoxyphenol hydroxylase-like FAD-dependent oxidoreductase
MADTMTDVIVVGAGFSGSLAAILLGRHGYDVTLVDRYRSYPDEFRAEQLVGGQVDILRRFGVLEALVAGVPLAPRAIVGRRGRIIGCAQAPHYGLPYASMIARLRDQIPPTVKFIIGRVVSIEADSGKRQISLDDGTTLRAPLVVLATGMSPALMTTLGVRRTLVSKGHSLAIGFDIAAPRLGQELVMTYYGSPENLIDYITVFPHAGQQRANLFMYAQPGDPPVNKLQANPGPSLRALLPQLEAVLGDFTPLGRPVMRLNDIWVSQPSLSSVVVIGDAFQTPCPSAGTGINRLVNDVDLLCHTYIPLWLKTGDITETRLVEFYRDPAKRDVDRQALNAATYRRAVSTQTSLRWQVHRKRVEIVDDLRSKWLKLPPSIGTLTPPIGLTNGHL